MKKRILSIVITFFMVLALVPQAVFAADEVGDEYDFHELLKNLKSGNTITLDKDYKCALGFDVGKNATIDLNGHVMYFTGQDHRFRIGFNEYQNKTLTIKDSNPNAIHSDAQLAKLGISRENLPANVKGGVIVAPGGSSGGGGAVYISEGSTLNLEGGTIYNCNTTGYGGAVYALGKFNMSGGKISNCKASKSGGAICIKSPDVFTMSGGTIRDCSANESGGAVYNEKSFTMSGGTISNCKAVQFGGAVSNVASFTMTNGNIKDCSAPIGGGVFTGSTFTMNGGTIDNCKAVQFGGGVYNLKASTSAGKFTLDGGTIKNCNADKGAGVANISSDNDVADFTMNSGTIDNCNATSIGGGLYNEETGVSTMNGGTIKNCSANIGGGVIISGGGMIDESTGEIIPTSSTINTKCKFNMNGGSIENCRATSNNTKGYGGGVLAFYATFTMNNGTIKNCSAPHKESASVCLFANATMYADGGSVYGQSLVFGQVNDTVSEITNTDPSKYTKFYNLVENQGTISGGVFYGGINNTKNKKGVYGNVTSPFKIVTFDSNGGSSVPAQWLVNAKGATALKPTNPTRENYKFMGWYKGNNEYDFTTAVPENTIGFFTLTAKWVKKNVSTEDELREALDAGITSIKLVSDFELSSTLDLSDKDITLDLNGHILKGNIKLSDSSNVRNPSELTLIDSNPTATHTSSNLPLGGVLDGKITLDKKIFGSSSRLCANGGTVTGQVVLNNSATQIICTSTTPTAFMDYVGGSGAIHGGMFYGGVKQGCIEEKIVTFLSDSQPYAVGVVESGNFAVAPIDPVKDGYVFAGWYIGNTKYNFKQPVIQDIALNAKWVNEVTDEANLRAAINEGITTIKLMADINLSVALDLSQKDITIDLNGYVISGADIRVNTGNGKASLTLKDSRPTANHTDSTLPLGGVVTSKISMKQDGGGYNDCVLYANGGTVTSEFSTNTNAVAIKCTSNTPTAFTGKISGYAHLYGGIYYGTVNSSVTFEESKITFKNGDSNYAYEVLSSDKKSFEPISPSVMTGYQAFDGWYNGNTKYTFGSSLSQDITLTAKYKNPLTYNITYNLGGGTATNPTGYTVESDAITLNNPVKTGYTFTGWSGTGLTGENNMTVTIPKGSTGNRDYTAHFSQNSYTVAFDTVGGSGISDKAGVKWADQVLSGITNPTKEGWEFTGWKCGDMTVNANTKYSNLAANDTVTSVTLVAQWKDIQKPVITSLENGKTYCDAVEFEVSDNDGIASVKAGNNKLTAGTNGKYTLEKGIGTVTVIVTDNAGNIVQVSVTVNNGHTFGEWQSNGDDTHTRYCTVTGCNGSEDGDCEGGQASYFKKAVCDECNKAYGELLTDSTAPTGEISIGTSKWNSFLNTITFGLFFKDTQSVTVKAADDSYDHAGYTDDKAVKVEYYLYSGDTALTKADLASKTFTAYSGTFNINPDNKYVVYARLTDHAGNVTYISSECVVLDATTPVIYGVENGKVYCEAQTVTVTEDYIESVKVNGTAVTLDENNRFSLNPAEGTQTIVVTDKAGNVSAEMTVTVNDGHTYEWQDDNGQYWKKCKFCGDETAKKDIPTITIDGADVVCVTQDYKFSFTLPQGATDAVYGYEFENKGDDGLPAIIENNELFGIVPVTEYEPSENSFKVCAGAKTADGFEFFVSKTVQIQNEHAGGVATCVELAICDTCGKHYGELDSTNHNLEKIPAKAATVTETGNKEYWHCLDCGKYFADENGENEIELADTVIATLPPEIIEGKGQSATEGEKKELTFRSNAAFSDFIRVELDGKTLDEKNYTVKEGSTVVTLKADYVATLSAGEHTIGIVSTNGTATTTFTVKAKTAADNDTDSPQTGDNSHMALWIAVLFVSGGALIVTGIYSRKKKHSKH